MEEEVTTNKGAIHKPAATTITDSQRARATLRMATEWADP